MGAPAPPRAEKKIFRPIIYRKMCKCIPQDTKCIPLAKARVNFRPVYAGWVRLYLDAILRATTKKVVNFFGKKVHPRQNPGYAYVSRPRTATDSAAVT